MNETVKFIGECGMFYIATEEGDQARVRPFAVFIENDGKIYSATTNKKEVFKQLKANPKIEICATSKDMRWVRIQAKAIFTNNMDVKTKMLDDSPQLKAMYHSAENPDLEVFCIADGVATFYSMQEAPRTIKL